MALLKGSKEVRYYHGSNFPDLKDDDLEIIVSNIVANKARQVIRYSIGRMAMIIAIFWAMGNCLLWYLFGIEPPNEIKTSMYTMIFTFAMIACFL